MKVKELPQEKYFELGEYAVKEYLMGMFNKEIQDKYYIKDILRTDTGNYLLRLNKRANF